MSEEENGSPPRFSGLLRAARGSQGLTRKEAAMKLGVAVTTYRNAENGRGTPLVFAKIREAFPDDADEILAAWREHRDLEAIPVAPPDWLSEEELIEKLQRFSGMMRMTNLAIARLEESSDEDHALTLALLVTILLTGEDVDDPAKAFLSYLLSAFRPFASQFDRNGSISIGSLSFRRWINGHGRWRLLARKEGWDPDGLYPRESDEQDDE